MVHTCRVGIVGVGNLGRAVLRGLVAAGWSVWGGVRTEASRAALQAEVDAPIMTDYREYLGETDLLLVAVKPNAVATVCQSIHEAGGLRDSAVVVSTAAGVDVRTIEEAFEETRPVVRAMPNLACQIGQGMTLLCRGSRARDEHLGVVSNTFATVGETLEIEERMMDVATALCASGPAFLLLAMEAMADAAVQTGMRRDIAMRMIAATLRGTAALAAETGRHPADLRDKIASPGGCTIAGLRKLEEGRLRSTITEAILEASRVAGKLG